MKPNFGLLPEQSMKVQDKLEQETTDLKERKRLPFADISKRHSGEEKLQVISYRDLAWTGVLGINPSNLRGEKEVNQLSKGLISVIVPIYNTEKYLSQCLNSILNQKYKDLEVICIDDGSTDQSFFILQRLASQDARIKVIHQENQGQGKARNNGLEYVSGEFVVFLDSDDWFEPDFLGSMIKQARDTKADIAICCSDEYDTNTGKFGNGSWMLKKNLLPKSTFAPEEAANSLFQFTYGWAWDKLYRTAFIRDNNLFFPSLQNSEDLVFVFKSLFFASRITVVNQNFIHHRINRVNSVSNLREHYPMEPFRAVQLVYSELLSSGLISQYKESFFRWEINFLIWHMSTLTDKKQKKIIFNELKTKWIPFWRDKKIVQICGSDYFTIGKFTLATALPYSLFCFMITVYRFVKSLME